MKEVKALAPHCLTHQGIDLRACGAVGELGELQLDMAFQHERIDTLHLVSHGAERDSARDIRGAIHILCATVEEQKTMRLERDVRLRCRLIVDDGAMRVVSGNGIETDIAEEGLLSAEPRELLVDAYLCLTSRFRQA